MMLKVAKGLLHAYRRHQHEKEVVASIKSMDARDQRILDAFEGKNGVVPLTDGERQIKNEFWRRYFPYDFGDAYFSLTKMAREFDASNLPDSVFFTFVFPKLNQSAHRAVFTDKGLLGWWYKDCLRPRDIVRNVRGVYYSSENDVLSRDEAVDRLVDYGKRVIVKKSAGSRGGFSVSFVDAANRMDVQKIMAQYGDDFVCQEVVDQCDTLRKLNPSSLNTIRVTSLFINGKYSTLSNCLRFGAKGQLVDNVCSGGYMVGVMDDGRLCNRGFNMTGDIITRCYDGRMLNEVVIPNFDRVSVFVQKLHEAMPYLGIAGWDIAINAEGAPVLIETNVAAVGICHQQMCTGPIFGSRFDEVMDYVGKNA